MTASLGRMPVISRAVGFAVVSVTQREIMVLIQYLATVDVASPVTGLR